MAIRKKTIGVAFPFEDSVNGDYIQLNSTPENEIKSNLIHLIMTRKGERYWLPEFGTNIHQYLFDPNDEQTEEAIRQEITDAVERFMPNLRIEDVVITNYLNQEQNSGFVQEAEYKLTVRVDYRITTNTFESKSFVILTF